jgi:hypothetical protein
MGQFGSRWKNFLEILLRFSLKYVEKVQVPLKSEQKKGTLDEDLDTFVSTLVTVCNPVFRKWGVGVWTGLSWLRIEAGGGHL